MIKYQLKRAICSKLFIFAVLLYSGSIIIQAILAATGANKDFLDFLGHFGALNLFLFGTNLTGTYISLPAAGLFVEDVSTGYYKYYIYRTSKIKYMFSKIIAAVTSGAVFALVSTLVALLIFFVIDPHPSVNYFKLITDETYFRVTFMHSLTLLNLMQIIITVLYSASFSMIGLTFSPLIKNRYLVYIIPYLVMILINVFSMVFQIDFIISYIYTALFTVWSLLDIVIINISIILVCIPICIFSYYIGGERYV